MGRASRPAGDRVEHERGWSVLSGDGVLVARSRLPLVGRREEQRRVVGALDDAAGGRARLIVISGPAGIGKTRFLSEMREIGRSRGYDVTSGRGLYYEDRLFQTLHGGLVQHLREVLGQPGILASAEPAVVVGDVGAGEAEAETAVAETPMANLGAGNERWRHTRFDQIGELADLVAASARRRPLLVTVDDASLADDASLDVLERAVAHDVPLVVAFAVQKAPQGLPDRFERLVSEGAIELRLPPLNRLETFEMLRELGVQNANQVDSAEPVEAVARASAGNPLYLELAACQQAMSSAAAPPTSVMEAYEATLSTLPDETTRLLRTVALVGDDLDPGMVAELVGLTEQQLLAGLRPAADVGVVDLGVGSIGLRHPVARGVVVGALANDERRELHFELARAMEGSERWSMLASVRHLIQAGPVADGALVATMAVEVAREIMVLGLWHEAASLFEAAITGAERSLCWSDAELAEVHLSSALARVAAGDVRLAEQNAVSAQALYTDAGDDEGAARAMVLRYRCLVFSGEFGVLLDRKPLLDLAERRSVPVDLRVEALITASELGWMTGDHTDSGTLADRAACIGQESGLIELAVRGLVSRATSEWLRLDLEGSLATLDASLELAGSSVADQVVAAGRRSFNLWLLGRVDEAVSGARHALELAQQARQPLERSIPLSTGIAVAAARGEVGRAEELGYEALVLQRVSDDRWAGNFFLPSLAGLAAARGDVDAALTRLEELGDGSEGASQELAALIEVHVRTLCGVATDDDRAIIEHLSGPEAETILPGLRLGSPAILSLVVEAADLLDAGAAEFAAAGVAEAMERGQMITSTLHYLLPRVVGTAARLAGDLDRSVAVLEDAAGVAAAQGLAVEGARVYLELAVSLARRDQPGDEARAVFCGRSATAEFARLGLRGLSGLARRQLPQHIAAQLDHEPSSSRGAAVCVTSVVKYGLSADSSGGDPSWQLVLHGQRGIIELATTFGGVARSLGGSQGSESEMVVTFDEVQDAVEYGLRSVARARTHGVQIRVGVVAGADNIDGAQRLAGAADGNRVLIDELARRSSGEQHMLSFSPRSSGFEVRAAG